MSPSPKPSPSPSPSPSARPPGRSAPFGGVITSQEELQSLYRLPMKIVREKKRDHLEPWARAVVAASRFAFIATADADGRATVSPRGGDDGFVVALDDRHLAIPDYPGNNLTDSLRNVVDNPRIGIAFLIPGRNETLRVDGEAWVTTDPDVIARCGREGRRRPKTAIGVRTTSVFFHCPSSFERAALWDRAAWRDDVDQPFDDFIRAALPEDDWPDWAR